MHRRRYLTLLGAGLLAGCASPDESGSPGSGGSSQSSGPPTMAYGESSLLGTGVEVTCGGLEQADAFEIDGESHPAPDGQTWALVDFRAENASDSSQTLPWRQALWVRTAEGRVQHDVNHAPDEFLFWDGGYEGGDEVDPGVVEEGIVPIPVDAGAAETLRAVIYKPILVNARTEVWWTEG